MKRKNSANKPTSQPEASKAAVFKTNRKAAKSAASPAAVPSPKAAAAPPATPKASKPATPPAKAAKATPAPKPAAKPVAVAAKAAKAAPAKPEPVKPKAAAPLPATTKAPAKAGKPAPKPAAPPARAKKAAAAKASAPKPAAKRPTRSVGSARSAGSVPSAPSPRPAANSPDSLPAPKPSAALAGPAAPMASQRPAAEAAAMLLPTPRPPAIVVVPEPPARSRPAKLAPPPTPASFPAILLEPEDSTPVEDPLPSGYGFSRVHLAAREPHVLSVIWELAGEWRHSLPPASKLSLLIHADRPLPGLPFMLDLPSEGSFLFVTVPHADIGYQVELGHLDATGRWKSAASSAWVHTPPEAVAPLQSPVFVTLPPPAPAPLAAPEIEPPAASNPALLPEPHPAPAPEPAAAPWAPEPPAPRGSAPFAPPPSFAQEAMPTDWSHPIPANPPPAPAAWSGPAAPSARSWTRAHTEVLTHLAGIRPAQARPLPNSGTLADLGEVLTQTLAVTHETRGAEQGPLAAPSSPVSSQPGRPAPRGFWLNINAEVIVYGATDPAARLLAGGRPVRLREDGTFSFRFSLPDGEHPLPFQAISPDGLETRSAALTFSRASVYSGGVAAHPQDPALRPPSPSHI